ncbi:uncharacterized protein M6B38_267700 [Iris pallida]|uniref:CRM domain-containing protein n=1 Tax=Iris pallida TaxID=29817 RepID=A0AAX6I8D5_IRIPA|nr:uncharacterized protein M6B38_267700 [Iris pallida]
MAMALAASSGCAVVRLSLAPPRRLSPPTCSSSIRLFCAASSNVTSLNMKEEEGESRTNGAGELKSQSLSLTPPPQLTVKERKELASYAHGLGKKLKSQQVGKSGVTPSLAASFVENLESNELLKLKVHGTCPGELVDVIKQLEAATGSVAVDQIGRSVILYRPSLSKMKKREAASARRSQGSPAKTQRKWQPSGVSS